MAEDVNVGSISAKIDLALGPTLNQIDSLIKSMGRFDKSLSKMKAEAGTAGQKTAQALDSTGKKAALASREIGKIGRDATIAAKGLDKASKETKDLGKELQKTKSVVKNDGLVSARAVSSTVKSLNKIKTATKKLNREMKKEARDARAAARAAKRDFTSLGSVMGTIRGQFPAIAAGASALTAGALIGGGIRSASEIEQGFVGVRRTTGLEGKEFEDLRKEILALSGELRGIPTSSLQEIATIAGQLGIRGTRNITTFTETVAKASLAMDMSAESAGNYLARLSNLFKIPIADVANLASTINELGNTTTARAEEVAEITVRFGGLAKVFGLSAQEAAALSATTRDFGINMEVAGTSWVRILGGMLSDTEAFADIAGKSMEEFSQTMREKPLETIKMVAQGLNGLDAQQVSARLDELSMSGTGVDRVLIGLAGSIDLLDKNLVTANRAFAEGESLNREYSAAADTMAASVSQLGNALKLLADTTFKNLNKELSGLFTMLSTGVRIWAGYTTAADEAVKRADDNVKTIRDLMKSYKSIAEKEILTDSDQSKLNEIANSLLKVDRKITIDYDEITGNVKSVDFSQIEQALSEAEKTATMQRQDNLLELSNKYDEHSKKIEKQIALTKQWQRGLDEIYKNIDRGITTRETSAASIKEYTWNIANQKRALAEMRQEAASIEKQITDGYSALNGGVNADKKSTGTTGTLSVDQESSAIADELAAAAAERSKTSREIYADLKSQNEILSLQGEKEREILRIEQDRVALHEKNKTDPGAKYEPMEFHGPVRPGEEPIQPSEKYMAAVEIERSAALQRAEIDKKYTERAAAEQKKREDDSLRELNKQKSIVAQRKSLLESREKIEQDSANALTRIARELNDAQLRVESDRRRNAADEIAARRDESLQRIEAQRIDISVGNDNVGEADDIPDVVSGPKKQKPGIQPVDNREALRRLAAEELAIEQQYYRDVDALRRQDLAAELDSNSRAVSDAIARLSDEKAEAIERSEGRRDIAARLGDDLQRAESDHQARILQIEKEFLAQRSDLVRVYADRTIEIERAGEIDRMRLKQDAFDKELRLRREAASDEQKILDKQQRAWERAMRDRERSFRRIFEPLFSGEGFGDVLKNALKEDFIDFAAKNFPLSIPLGDQQGGIFSRLLGNSVGGINPSPTERVQQTDMNVSLAQPQDQRQIDLAESTAEATKRTAVAAEQTTKGIAGLPINMGNVLGASLGAILSNGKITAGSVGTTFGMSLAGGLLQKVMSGFSSNVAAPTAQTTPVPQIRISETPMKSTISSEKGLTDNKPSAAPTINQPITINGNVDRNTMPELRRLMKETALQTYAESSRRGGIVKQMGDR